MHGKMKQPTSCYCLKTRRASASITKFYDQMLAPCGVTARQYSLLLNIPQTDNCSVRELSDMIDLDRSTLARSLKPLYTQGLIIDNKAPGTRNSQLELTDKGKQVVLQAMSLWEKAQQSLMQKIGDEKLRQLDEIYSMLELISE